MNCDFESGSLLLSRQKSSARGPGLSIISGHFITALHTGPNCYKQSGPFLSHPGVECEGQFDRLLTCPGLSHYHLRGLLKGSKSHPLVCYPSSTFCIMRAFIAHLIPSAGKSVIFPLFLFTGFVLFVHRGYAGEAETCTHTHTHAHPLYLKIIPESLKLLKYGWMLHFFGAAATSSCAADEISCYHPGICRVLSNYSFCCSLHRPAIDLQEEGGRYTWGVGVGGERGGGGRKMTSARAGRLVTER